MCVCVCVCVLVCLKERKRHKYITMSMLISNYICFCFRLCLKVHKGMKWNGIFLQKKKKKEWNECIIKEGKEMEPFFLII